MAPSLQENQSPYYSIIAGGVRTKLLESVIETKLFDLFIDNNTVLSESTIIHALQLHTLRAKKWLYLLADQQFLIRDENHNEPMYTLGSLGKKLKAQWWPCTQMVLSWQTVAKENLLDVLKGKAVITDVCWPPRTYEDSAFLEEWMTKTAPPMLDMLRKNLDLSTTQHLLDIGGGDGTVACTLAKHIPHLKITIYNLPQSIAIAQEKIQAMHLSDKINTYTGDFIKESAFPKGYDFLLFCRVLWDWSLETNKKLLQMAYHALPPGGKIGICEAFKEDNYEFTLAWEYRYIFWNDFEIAVFKTSSEYIALLKEIGFVHISFIKEMYANSGFAILIAQKPVEYR